MFVVACNLQPGTSDGVRGGVITIEAGIEVGQPSVLFREWPVAVPAKAQSERQVAAHLVSVVDECARCVGAIVAAGATVESGGRGGLVGTFHEVEESIEPDDVGIGVVIDDVELGMIPQSTERQSVPPFHPIECAAEFPLVLIHAGVAETRAGSEG